MAAPNLQTATIQSTTDVWAATNTLTTRITVAANTSVLVKSIRATNIHASTIGWVTITLNRSSTDYHYTFQQPVPVNGTIECVTGILNLDASDLLKAQVNASSNIELITSYFTAS